MAPSRPLVLLPGALSDARLFAHQATHLADIADARVVELPDHARVGAMAAAVLAAAPARFALAGLSLGAIVALEIVHRAPARVERLALLATSPAPDPPELRAVRRAAAAKARAGALEAQLEVVLPLLLAAAHRRETRLVAAARAMALAVGGARYARQLDAIAERADPRPRLGAIACPTLVLGGRDDAVTPPDHHARLAAAIPGARHAVVEQAGHLVALEQPVATTALLRDWLTRRR